MLTLTLVTFKHIDMKCLHLLYTVLLSLVMFSCDKQSSDAKLLSVTFKVQDKEYKAEDQGSNNWKVSLPASVDLAQLETPKVVVSEKATYSPANQTDFSQQVEYKVTAEDGTEAIYRLAVLKARPSGLNALESIEFTIGTKSYKAVPENGSNVWNISFAKGIDLSKLPNPTVKVSPLATYAPKTQTDFSKDVTYTITSESGVAQQVILRASVEGQKSSAKEIVSIRFMVDNQPYSAGTRNQIAWGAQLPWSVDLANVPTPQIQVSPKATYSPKNHTDFSKRVTYTITAEDGSTKQITLGVGKAIWARPDNYTTSSEKKITGLYFNIASRVYSATINEETKAITIKLPSTVDLTNLPAPAVQKSPKATFSTTSATDFSSPVTYTVTAEDKSTQQYKLTVTKETTQQIVLTQVKFNVGGTEIIGEQSTSDPKHFIVTVPTGTDITSLTKPSLTFTPADASYSPQNQTNFSSPVNYFFNKNSDQAAYQIKVVVAKSTTAANTDFVTEWTTSAANQYVKLPLYQSGDYDFQVDWGDGTVSQVDITNYKSKAIHRYTNAGKHTLRIKGKLEGFSFTYIANSGFAHMLTDIKQWGNMKLAPSGEAYNTAGSYLSGCSNLKISASDKPDLSGILSLFGMFYHATNFNSDISHWDVSGITNMSAMFLGANKFNHDLSGWNVSKVNKCDAFRKDYSKSSSLTDANMPNFTKCSE